MINATYEIKCKSERMQVVEKAAFLKQGVSYTVLGLGSEQEYVVVKVWAGRKEVVIMKHYLQPSTVIQCQSLEASRRSQPKVIKIC